MRLIAEEPPFFTDWIRQNGDSVKYFLDEFFAMALLNGVSDMVWRTLQLAALNAKDIPSKQTNRYVMEASRTYIEGFDMASVAMCRAALEQALKERLGRQGDGNFSQFRDLVSEAKKCNLLSQTGFSAAKDLAKQGDHVLHEGPVKDEETALQVLIGVRSILEEIYSATGHY